MGYAEKKLQAGEVVLYRTRLHWISFVTSVVIAIALIAGFFDTEKSVFDQLYLVAFFFIGISNVVKYFISECAVTNLRIICKIGVIKPEKFEQPLTDIKMVQIEQGYFNRILGYGKIIVHMKTGESRSFDQVDNAEEFQTQVHAFISVPVSDIDSESK